MSVAGRAYGTWNSILGGAVVLECRLCSRTLSHLVTSLAVWRLGGRQCWAAAPQSAQSGPFSWCHSSPQLRLNLACRCPKIHTKNHLKTAVPLPLPRGPHPCSRSVYVSRRLLTLSATPSLVFFRWIPLGSPHLAIKISWPLLPLLTSGDSDLAWPGIEREARGFVWAVVSWRTLGQRQCAVTARSLTP